MLDQHAFVMASSTTARFDRSVRGLDQFVASLAGASIDSAPRAEQIAFWLNAYNALVLRTVIDHYPIRLRAANYPAHGIRHRFPALSTRFVTVWPGRRSRWTKLNRQSWPVLAIRACFGAGPRGTRKCTAAQ